MFSFIGLEIVSSPIERLFRFAFLGSGSSSSLVTLIMYVFVVIASSAVTFILKIFSPTCKVCNFSGSSI